MASLTADGDSESWIHQKDNVARILEQFNKQDTGPDDAWTRMLWDNLPESVLCRQPYYERLAHFLVHTYKIPKGVKNSGLPLACDSVRNYMGTAINRAASKFKAGGDIETKEFFFCLDAKSSSDSATWLHKLKKKIQRVTFERAKEAGEQQDKSEGAPACCSNARLPFPRADLLCARCAAPVYLEDVALIARSYARAGHSEGATRKLAIISTQRAAGRSSEVAWTTWDGMTWDKKFKHVFVEYPQPKGSKVKLAAFGAGVNRHSDWFVALADYLVLQPDRAIYSDDDPAWFLPVLQKTGSPGTTLGNFIKALLPADRGGHDSFQDARLVLPELPPGATAGGLRPGASNELRAAMPSELAMHITAHDFTSFSAFFEYIDCTRAGCMPGSVVLGGWEPFPWGHMGKGPVPPSLTVLQNMAVDMEAVEMLIDILFRLDSATPPMLWRQGILRPMVHAAFASMVMYFNERKEAGEMHTVLAAMCHAIADSRIRLDEGAAPVVFSRWGAALRMQFDLDNLHLTQRSADTGLAQVISVVQQVGRQVGGMHATIGALQKEVSQLSNMGMASPTPSSRAAGTPSSRAPSRAPSSHNAAIDSSSCAQGEAEGGEEAPSPLALLPPPPPPPPNAFDALLPASSSAAVASLTITDRTAKGVYEDMMDTYSGVVPDGPKWAIKQHRPKAELCVKWFNGFATSEEQAELKPAQAGGPEPDQGERRKLIERLHQMVVARLRAAYRDKSMEVPRDLAKADHVLPASGIASHVEKLKQAIDISTFLEWRKLWEQVDSSEAAAGAAAAKPKKRKRSR